VIGSAQPAPRWNHASLRRLLLVSAAVLIPVLAGCEAGNNAPVLNFHPPTDAAGLVAGELSIRNVFVLGAPLGSSLQPGQSASLFFSIVNDGTADRLLSITAPGSAASVTLPGGSVAVDPGKPVLFNGPVPQSYLVDLSRTLASGSDFSLVFHFQREGAVTVQVPVLPAAAHYATYSMPPSPTPSASATTTAHKHRTVTPTPSATPSPSAS
jgi:copper(I)-binding protein